MPELGEEAKARDIGKKGDTRKFSWVMCPRCKEERWVHKKGGATGVKNTTRLCRECAILTAKHGFQVWSNSTFHPNPEERR